MAIPYPIRFAAQLRQHLRAFRKARNLTQAQLGELVGVSQGRIAEIEANPGLVKFEQLLQILSAMNVTLSLEEDQHMWQATESVQNVSKLFIREPEKKYVVTEDKSRKKLRDNNKKKSPSKQSNPHQSESPPTAVSSNKNPVTHTASAADMQKETLQPSQRNFNTLTKKGTW